MTPCEICGDPSEQWHHIQPRSVGGHNGAANLMRVCRPCHRTIHAWFGSVGANGRAWRGPNTREHTVSMMREGPPKQMQVPRSMWGNVRAAMKRNGIEHAEATPHVRSHFINRHTAL